MDVSTTRERLDAEVNDTMARSQKGSGLGGVVFMVAGTKSRDGGS